MVASVKYIYLNDYLVDKEIKNNIKIFTLWLYLLFILHDIIALPTIDFLLEIITNTLLYYRYVISKYQIKNQKDY